MIIIAAAFISGLAETTRASDSAGGKASDWQKRWPWLSSDKIAACLGLVAGIGAVPASAFALLTPLLRPLAGNSAQRHESGTISLALAISASHGLVWLTPVPIAAAAILGAEWQRVALFGLPLAALLAGFGAVFARRQSMIGAAARIIAAAAGRRARGSSGTARRFSARAHLGDHSAATAADGAIGR